jgi:hypothetical protein
MATNNLFINSSSGASSGSVASGINSVTSGLGSVLNSIDSLALPLEQGVGNFSQLYTQVKQLNPQAQTSIPVNEAFYQAPQNSLTANFANGVGAAFGQIPWYIWGAIGIGVIGIIAFAKKR